MTSVNTLPNPLKKPQSRIILEVKPCTICGATMRRKYYGMQEFRAKSGKVYIYEHWETPKRFSERYTCSEECRRIRLRGKTNPNYRGLMPTCSDCGARTSYDIKRGHFPTRCMSCFKIWAQKNDYYMNRPQAKKIAQTMRDTKGTYPEQLRPYAFKNK